MKINISKHSNERVIKTTSLVKNYRKRRHEEEDDEEDDDDEDNRDGSQNGQERYRSTEPSKQKTRNRDYSSLIKYFFKDCCFFIIKSNNAENVEISQRLSVWSTMAQNEAKLNAAFKQFRNVLLIFSVKESGHFQGFARLASEADYDCPPVSWVLPSHLNSVPFGGVFYVDWICKQELSFNETTHLRNTFNEGKPVKIARDGQEVDPMVGEQLCRLFPADESSDLVTMLKRMKKQTAGRPKKKVSSKHHRPTASSNGDNSRGISSSLPSMVVDREEVYGEYRRLTSSSSNVRQRLGVANDRQARTSSTLHREGEFEHCVTSKTVLKSFLFPLLLVRSHHTSSSSSSSLHPSRFLLDPDRTGPIDDDRRGRADIDRRYTRERSRNNSTTSGLDRYGNPIVRSDSSGNRGGEDRRDSRYDHGRSQVNGRSRYY